MPKNLRRKPGRVVRRKLADGTTKEYHYAAYKRHSRVLADSVIACIRAYRRSPGWSALAPSTQSGYGFYLRHLEAAMGDSAVAAVTRRDIITIRDGIARTKGNGAGNGFLRACGAFFTWAVDAEWLEHSPVHKVKRLPGSHLPAWTIDQARVALSGIAEHFRRAILLGLYTGQRRGDLCSVRWSAYTGHEIAFIQQKTGAKVTLPVHPELKAELDTWNRTAVTILTDARGRPWNANKLSVTLPLALRSLGLPAGLNVHGLRKLFAASIADGGGTTHQIAAGTGHRTLGMVSLYTQSADQKRLGAEAVALLPRFGKNK
jgi:integrase